MYRKISRIYDRYRWLRSDGTPNFSQKIKRVEGDAKRFAKTLREIYSPNISLLKLFEIFYKEKLVALPLIKTGTIVDSVVSNKDLISFLGGVYSGIIEVRHKGDLIEALYKEIARYIARRDFPRVYENDDLETVLETMVLSDAGYVIVIGEKNNFVGIITDTDIIEYFRGRPTGVLIRDVMSRNVVTARYTGDLCKIIKDMNDLGIRRIPLIRDDGSLAGIISSKDLIEFIGSHKIFSYLNTGRYEEFCKLPAHILLREAVIVSEEIDIGEVSERMFKEDVEEFIVARDNEIIGIVSKRDLVYGFVVLSKQ